MAKTLNMKKLNTESMSCINVFNTTLVEERRLQNQRNEEKKPLRKIAGSDSATTSEKNDAIIKMAGIDEKYKPLLDSCKERKERALSELFGDEILATRLYIAYLWSIQTSAIDKLNSTIATPVVLKKGLKTTVEVSFFDCIKEWFDRMGLEVDDTRFLKKTIARVAGYASTVRMKFTLGKDGKFLSEDKVVATYIRKSTQKQLLSDLVFAFLQSCLVDNKCFEVSEDGFISIRESADSQTETSEN